MGINFNKKVRCKCKKCKQVTEVDTLVHLYDSLNDQIEGAQNEIKAYTQVGISSDISAEAKAKFEAAYTEMEKRLINQLADSESEADFIAWYNSNKETLQKKYEKDSLEY